MPETYFDNCELSTVEGIPQTILSCINFMGETDQHVVFNNKYAICEYHYCAIILNRVTNRHNTLTCSGGIMRFGDDNYFFNPITLFKLDFSKMLPLPTSAVEVLGYGLEFFYSKDIRTTFQDDIMDVTCTNDFQTCLRFHNGTVCFGNTQDIGIMHTPQAYMWGCVNSIILGAFVLFFLTPRLKDRHLWYLFFLFVIPVAGVSLIVAGTTLGPKIPFTLGSLTILILYPFAHYLLKDMNEEPKYQRI